MDKKLIVYLVVAISFLLAGSLGVYYGYKEYKKSKENSDYTTAGDSVDIILHYVDWCPYSTEARKTWEFVKEDQKKHDNLVTNSGKTIYMKEVDCTNQTEDNYSKMNGKDIDAYPTIYADNFEDPQLELTSKCTAKELTSFIEEVKRTN